MKYLIENTEKGLFYVNKEMSDLGEIADAIIFDESEIPTNRELFTLFPLTSTNDVFLADVTEELQEEHGYTYGNSEEATDEEMDDLFYLFGDDFGEVANNATTYREAVKALAEIIAQELD